MAFGSGSDSSWEVTDRGPLFEKGPLVVEAAVSVRGGGG